jgi:hypothetical protein
MDNDLIHISPYQMFLLHLDHLKQKVNTSKNLSISLNFLLNILERGNLKLKILRKNIFFYMRKQKVKLVFQLYVKICPFSQYESRN